MNKSVVKNIVWRPKNSSERLALELVKLLRLSGFRETYIIGGYIRDLLLKRKETGAIDVATEARPEQVIKLFEKKFHVIPTGLKHGTVTVHKDGEDIEITTFRTEGKYLDARRPEKVDFITDPAKDSSRRDFTINALYFDPIELRILDFQGGLKDLKAKKLRFVGQAQKRISEDALRMMRAVRFASVLGFRLSTSDLAVIKKNSRAILKISSERVKQELDKIMLSKNIGLGFKLLLDAGLLARILPEFALLAKTRQSKNYHSEGSVFVHTMLALSLLDAKAGLATRYGLLFHDIGKGGTAKKIKKHGREHISFHGHQELGEKLVRQILPRLRFSRKEIEDIVWYVRHHHVPVDLPNMRRGKKMAWCLDPRFANLLQIFRSDSLASVPTDKQGRKLKPSLELYNYALRTYKKALSQPQLTQVLVSGSDVMKTLKIKEGPRVGEVLRKVRDQQLEGNLQTREHALQWLKSQV